LFWLFETGSLFVAQTGLELTINPPVSACQVPGLQDVHHGTWLSLCIFIRPFMCIPRSSHSFSDYPRMGTDMQQMQPVSSRLYGLRLPVLDLTVQAVHTGVRFPWKAALSRISQDSLGVAFKLHTGPHPLSFPLKSCLMPTQSGGQLIKISTAQQNNSRQGR
jgi:hypothetical protein